MGRVSAGRAHICSHSHPYPCRSARSSCCVISFALWTASWAAGRRGSGLSWKLGFKEPEERSSSQDHLPQEAPVSQPSGVPNGNQVWNQVSGGSCENGKTSPSSCSQSLQTQTSPRMCKSKGHCHLVAQKPRYQEGWERPCAPEGPHSQKWLGLNFTMEPK